MDSAEAKVYFINSLELDFINKLLQINYIAPFL